jgi:WhiB family redox-sensing transcriptional regulator
VGFDGARCASVHPDTFFPEDSGGEADPHSVRIAKAICDGCPAAGACLERALALRVSHGIWGGLTSAERRRLHPRRTRVH